MVKALRSCLEAAKGENQGRSLDPQKKPQENSYRIFYSIKYIPYTHSTPGSPQQWMLSEFSGSPPSIRITEPAIPIPGDGLDHPLGPRIFRALRLGPFEGFPPSM